jgi:hypothetical protein
MTKIADVMIRTGGLMRCCTATIFNLPDEYEVSEGDIIDCEYEKKPTMTMRDNAIEWIGAANIQEKGI